MLPLNFKSDFINILKAELQDYGITMSPSESDEDVKIKFFNFKHRLIRPLRRQIHKSDKFTCPSECESGLAFIENKITNGDDLFAHLSKSILNLNYNDDLLNDWGIYHLHLGTQLGTDGFIQRTGPLLYAKFDDENAYFINVMKHGDWTKQEMVEVIHQQFSV